MTEERRFLEPSYPMRLNRLRLAIEVPNLSLQPISRSALAAALLISATALALAGERLPEPASTRAAFEAQYPKSGPSGSALELERLAAGVGIDLAPKRKQFEELEGGSQAFPRRMTGAPVRLRDRGMPTLTPRDSS
jgi:hypothetical protein